MLAASVGCATLFSGREQTVTVRTRPAGGSVLYQGQRIEDGRAVTLRKEQKTPRFDVGAPDRPHYVDVTYQADLWLIGDAALLLLGVIPGLIAFGVDAATGAWRNIDAEQEIALPSAAAAETAPSGEPREADRGRGRIQP